MGVTKLLFTILCYYYQLVLKSKFRMDIFICDQGKTTDVKPAVDLF